MDLKIICCVSPELRELIGESSTPEEMKRFLLGEFLLEGDFNGNC